MTALIPLAPSSGAGSAHVCTAHQAPAAARASIFLVNALERHDNAQLLRRKHRTLKDTPYRNAVWLGYWELNKRAESDLQKVVQFGALLHYGNPKATALADKVSRLNLERTLSRLEVSTC